MRNKKSNRSRSISREGNSPRTVSNQNTEQMTEGYESDSSCGEHLDNISGFL